MVKRLVKNCSVFILSLFLAGNAGMAQDKMYLSLDSARIYAIEHNKNLVNSGLAADEASQKLREAISQGLPQVDATIDYSNYFGSTASFGPGFDITFNPTSNLRLSVGQLLFSGSYFVGIQTARLLKEISETNILKTELDIKGQVTQAYYISLISLKSRQLVELNLENMNDVLVKTRAMVDTGIAEELDYDQLNVQANMLENALRGADRQVEMSLNMLRLQMGLESDVEIELTGNLEEIVLMADFENSLSNQFAINENLDFQMVQVQSDIAEKQINMQRSAYLPTITGFYNYTEKLLKPELDLSPKHVIGLNITIPVFSSGLRNSRVKQARINYEIAENQRDLISEQLMIQEKQLRFNLNSALEQYESQKANVDVAQRVFDNIRLKYQQGLVSSLDLTTANNNYLQAENSFITAMLQLLDAQIEFDKLLNDI